MEISCALTKHVFCQYISYQKFARNLRSSLECRHHFKTSIAVQPTWVTEWWISTPRQGAWKSLQLVQNTSLRSSLLYSDSELFLAMLYFPIFILIIFYNVEKIQLFSSLFIFRVPYLKGKKLTLRAMEPCPSVCHYHFSQKLLDVLS